MTRPGRPPGELAWVEREGLVVTELGSLRWFHLGHGAEAYILSRLELLPEGFSPPRGGLDLNLDEKLGLVIAKDAFEL